MALKDLFRRAPPKMVQLAQRSFVFGSMEQAKGFMSAAQAWQGMQHPEGSPMAGFGAWSGSGDMVSFLQTSTIAPQYGGTLIRSTTNRETLTYGYAQYIYERDRQYLAYRDPTASKFIEEAWTLMWNGMPSSYIPEVDDFLGQQVALGLLTTLQAAYQEYYQEGGALIYLEATGDPLTPLRRGDRPIAWTFIPAHQVIDTAEGADGFILTKRGETNPLLDHGIEYISFYPTSVDRARNTPIQVHGSRIIPVNLNPQHQKWWRTPKIPLNKIYDTLWELRDILFSRARGHFQGDPIVVDVDLSADAQKVLNFEGMTQDQRDKMSEDSENAVVAYNTGSKQSFSPVMGFKLRRLGAANLPDPKEDVMMLSSRLAHGSVWPVKFILASTKGNSDVSDQDLLILQGNIQTFRDTWGYKHLSKALLMGRIMGAGSLRMQDAHDLPPPQDLCWPPIRPLSPRDFAFTEKTDASIARALQEQGRKLPARLARKFPEDPRYPIPLWMASRGRDTMGKNTDVDPKNEPGSAGDTPTAKPAAKPGQPLAPPNHGAPQSPIPIPHGQGQGHSGGRALTPLTLEDIEDVVERAVENALDAREPAVKAIAAAIQAEES